MWTYRTYRWPDEATGRAAIAAEGWAEGTPPGVDLLVVGAWYPDAPAEGEEPVPAQGWWVATALRDREPPAAWSSARAAPLPGMPGLGPDDLLGPYQSAIDALVQATARGRSYNDAASCASYVASTVPTWRAEAEAFVAWRDQVYLESFEALAAVQAGTRPPPSVEDFVAGLSAMAWPA